MRAALNSNREYFNLKNFEAGVGCACEMLAKVAASVILATMPIGPVKYIGPGLLSLWCIMGPCLGCD